VLLVVSSADHAATADLLSRAEAWGLTRVWLGTGSRPSSGRAEHVVWLDGADPALASRSGDMVLLYHLLWELTHVVFEHPGLLEPEPECTEDVCITCSDEGRVAEVRTVRHDGMVDVLVGGVAETVDVTLVEPVAPGDLLLVHAGVALTTLADGRP
jgi:hydrogenase maturation factor